MTNAYEFLILLAPAVRPSRKISTAQFNGTVSNVYRGNGQRENEYAGIHTATYPVHLPAWIATTFDDRRDGAVMDPFMGTGTTIVAAEQLGRPAYGVEVSPRYCDVIIERWQRLTGQTAERVDHGR
jgi:DNA modification methylase